MSRELPRESRLFANEIIQGAPRMTSHLEAGLKALMDDRVGLIQGWIDAGKLASVDPRHLLFSIWATTQHYADFEAQVTALLPEDHDMHEGAWTFLETLYRKTLTP